MSINDEREFSHNLSDKNCPINRISKNETHYKMNLDQNYQKSEIYNSFNENRSTKKNAKGPIRSSPITMEFSRKKERKKKRKISQATHKNRYQRIEISSVQFASNYGRKEGRIERVRMEGTSLKINWDAAWHASDGLISRGFQPEIRPARATRLRPLSLTNARRD